MKNRKGQVLCSNVIANVLISIPQNEIEKFSNGNNI